MSDERILESLWRVESLLEELCLAMKAVVPMLEKIANPLRVVEAGIGTTPPKPFPTLESAPEATIVPAAGPPVRQKYEVTGRRADNMPELRRIASEETFNLLGPLASCHVPESAPEAKEGTPFSRIFGAMPEIPNPDTGLDDDPAPPPRCRRCNDTGRIEVDYDDPSMLMGGQGTERCPACQGRK